MLFYADDDDDDGDYDEYDDESALDMMKSIMSIRSPSVDGREERLGDQLQMNFILSFGSFFYDDDDGDDDYDNDDDDDNDERALDMIMIIAICRRT